MITKGFSRGIACLASSYVSGGARWMAVRRVHSLLRQRMVELKPKMHAEAKEFQKVYGPKKLGEYTVEQTIGGMRGIKALLTETSLLDENEGIRFRGLTIPDIQKQLPKFKGGAQPLPEGIFWLLLTGEVPTQEQVESLTAELHARSAVPSHVLEAIEKYPKDMHPMTQMSSAVLALQTESRFAQAYEKGCKKSDYWLYYLEDSLDLIARLPQVCAAIYRKFKGGNWDITPDKSLDWAGSFVKMLNFHSNPEFTELVRLHLCVHTDHEGGNVSAHATHLVGSALSDAYLSFASGLCGLAGPLHGLAAQEVLVWIEELSKKFASKSITREAVEEQVMKTLDSGNVIPGFGHAVLRRTDPRYMCFREFAIQHFPDDPDFKLVNQLFHVVPPILTKLGKVKNPWPNIDAHSGVCLKHYGFNDPAFFTVLFGLSRSIGVLSSLVLDRLYGLPIERPKSVTMELVKKTLNKAK